MVETQNQISENLINKIRGLLRMSKSDNENEADLAMRKAKALCVKYELDLASIEPDKTKNTEEPIVKGDYVELGKRMSVCQSAISNLLQSHFNVRVIYHGSRYFGQKIVFIGRKKDIEIATFLNSYLKDEFMRRWRRYYESNKPQVTLSHRGGYLWGLASGLGEKLSESQRETESERFHEVNRDRGHEVMEQVKQTYALAVVNHKKKLADKVDEYYPKLGSRRTTYVRNYNSFSDGKSAGRTININRPLGNGGVSNSLTM